MPVCGHTWEPVPNWQGRYRCQDCGAFAYKRWVVLPVDHSRDGSHDIVQRGPRITCYCCAVQGCDQPAVTKEKMNLGRRKVWRCTKHRSDK